MKRQPPVHDRTNGTVRLSRHMSGRLVWPMVATLLLLWIGPTTAEETSDSDAETVLKPLWEFGLFLGGAQLPHYLGSDQDDLYWIPLPYLIYRGKVVKSDRSGISGVFLDTDHWQLRLSLSGSPPVNDDNRARQGMDELDPLLEIGPSVRAYFIRDPNQSLYLVAAARQVLAFDKLDVSGEGIRGDLHLIYSNEDVFGDNRLRYGMRTGIYMNDGTYHSYFYDVDNVNVLPDRPSFNAHGGYGGFVFSQSLVRKLTPRLSFGGFVKLDLLQGADFEDSPLAPQEYNISVGAAILWSIRASKKRVDRRL